MNSQIIATSKGDRDISTNHKFNLRNFFRKKPNPSLSKNELLEQTIRMISFEQEKFYCLPPLYKVLGKKHLLDTQNRLAQKVTNVAIKEGFENFFLSTFQFLLDKKAEQIIERRKVNLLLRLRKKKPYDGDAISSALADVRALSKFRPFRPIEARNDFYKLLYDKDPSKAPEDELRKCNGLLLTSLFILSSSFAQIVMAKSILLLKKRMSESETQNQALMSYANTNKISKYISTLISKTEQ
ncbi:MAG: hypothetical protein QXW70_01430 [Candidatus Anstonellales archaeon]